MSSSHRNHGITYSVTDDTHVSWCECGWTSVPTDYRIQAILDESRHHLDATAAA